MRIRKLLSLLLALILCVSLLPAALAEGPAGQIAPAEEPDEGNVGVITPVDPQASPEMTGWVVPLWALPPADEINETKHTIEVPDVKLEDLTDESVYNAMMAMQTAYPEGMHWTNDDYYDWNGQTNYRGYGCAGFAFLLSDAAFGKLPARKLQVNYDALRPGDILRINSNTHSVIILQVFSDYVVVAEGNYNSSIHWGRTLSRSDVEASDYVFTRWLGPVDLDSCSMTASVEPSVFSYEQAFDMVATVTDKDGLPVPDVKVSFQILNPDGSIVRTYPLNGYSAYSTWTNDDGQAVLSFTFHKADGRITPGDYLVYAELKGTSSSGTISATAPFTLLPDNLPGDVNGDDEVDNRDVTRLLRYLRYPNVTVVEEALDVNGDGTRDVGDAEALIRYLCCGDVTIH